MPRLKRLEKGQGDARSNELMETLDKGGKLFNIFRGMANSPAALDAYLQLSGALGKGRLDAKTRESIALALAQANRCEYCLAAHTAIGGMAGMDGAAIHDARQGKSANAKTNAAVTLARTLIAKQGKVADADVQQARAGGLDDGEIAEVVANVALNLYTNFFNHLNQTDVDFPKVAL